MLCAWMIYTSPITKLTYLHNAACRLKYRSQKNTRKPSDGSPSEINCLRLGPAPMILAQGTQDTIQVQVGRGGGVERGSNMLAV